MQKITSLLLCCRPLFSLRNTIAFLKSACLLILLCPHHSLAQCGGAARDAAGISDNGTSSGVTAWTNPPNAQISDNARTTASGTITPGSPGTTHFLYLRNFSFNIPGNATICGIDVVIEHRGQRSRSDAAVKDYTVQLVSGSQVSSNYAKSTTWSDSDEVYIYGGDNDTWGQAWTPSAVSSNGFGVNIAVRLTAGAQPTLISAEIDHVYITVYSSNVLPIELLEFKAQPASGLSVDLDWTTVTETSNKCFVVERSRDAQSFELVGQVAGAGNSIQQLSYHVTDHYPYRGTSYYRLTQIDLNGSSRRYPLVSVDLEKKNGVIISSRLGYLDVSIPATNSLCDVKLFDAYGKEAAGACQYGGDNDMNMRIDTRGLSEGIYYVKVCAGEEVCCSKVLLQKP